jgi:ribonucleotide monophosphatase NagD (HAD superfamily)
MIGDSHTDIEAANNCSMESVLVLTGNGEKTKNILDINPTYISKDLNSISKNLMSSK